MRPILAIIALMAAGVVVTPARAETIAHTFTTKQGTRVALDAIYALKDDCSPGPFPELRINLMPAKGLVRAGAARYPIPTDRNCPNVDSRSLAISYYPYPNFVGEDVIEATITLSNGKQNTYRWTIKVTPQGQASLVAAP